MKYIKHIILVTIVALTFSACDDEIMEWQQRDPATEIEISEIPLSLKEKLERYDSLRSYSTFPIGMGIDMTLYSNEAAYNAVVNQNFHAVTVGYHMKHGPMVDNEGNLKFTGVDQFIQKLPEGMELFGHTLCWHQNQNGSYLRGLIAPEVIPDPPGTNLLDITGLQDGTFTGWGRLNTGAGIDVVDGKGLSTSSKAIQLISSSASSNAWDLQLETPEIAAINGHTYEISFYIKSNTEGKGRISFSGLSNSYPYKDWYASGGDWTEAFQTTTAWQQVKFTVDDFTESTFKFYFDLGYLSDVTYLIDVDNIFVIDLDAEEVDPNLLENGGFESGELGNWNALNAGDGIAVTNEEPFEGTYSLKMIAGESSTNPWDLQAQTPNVVTVADNLYQISFMVKADTDGRGRVSFNGFDNGYPWINGSEWINVTTTWQEVIYEARTATASGNATFSFDFGYDPGVTYYIDNVQVLNVTEPSDIPELNAAKIRSIIIDKSDEEKEEIIDAALKDWITQMVNHYKHIVTAWDVVNEPMDENGNLRMPKEGVEDEGDIFHWQKYLGKNYAVKAFKYARDAGNPTDTLFINDYNLEYSTAKVDGLVEYMSYIESQGVTIDGVATQMHSNINSDTIKIKYMFQKLASTGKLVKISELDIKTGTDAPTPEELEAQAHMYQLIVDMYKKYIPEAQQYGITLWGVADEDSWIEGDAPCLWLKDYVRKHAYKGFADGLAGRDVSEDFTGELIY